MWGKFLCLMALAIVWVSPVWADALCTSYIGQNVLTPDFSCQLGPLIFSNFRASATGLIDPETQQPFLPTISLSSGESGQATRFQDNVAYLFFQTNFNRAMGQDRDIIFAFTVTGGVTAIDGWLPGTGSRSIAEQACSVPFVEGTCAFEDTVGELTLTPFNTSDTVTLSAFTNPLYVRKDITLSPTATLSDFGQSFHIPEPMTLILIGSGLLGFGLLRGRFQKS